MNRAKKIVATRILIGFPGKKLDPEPARRLLCMMIPTNAGLEATLPSNVPASDSQRDRDEEDDLLNEQDEDDEEAEGQKRDAEDDIYSDDMRAIVGLAC